MPLGHEGFELHENFQPVPERGDRAQDKGLGLLQPHESTQEQMLTSIRTLVGKTRQAMILEDRYCQEQIIQIYRELGKQKEQLEYLTRILCETNERETLEKSSESDDNEHIAYRTDRQASDEISMHTESDSTDVFFDCISRCSHDDLQGNIEKSRAKFSGSPDYSFEARSTFFPEQYTVGRGFAEKLILVAIAELRQNGLHYFQKYFIIYLETPRSWRKVTVSAAITSSAQTSAFAEIASRDMEVPHQTLPESLKDQLEGVLEDVNLLDTITMISLAVTEDKSGHVGLNLDNLQVTEDLDARVNDEEMIRCVEHIGCPRFVKSDVVVRSRFSRYVYVIQMGSRLYIEKRLPFAGTSDADNDNVKNFFADLRFFQSLSGCNAITKFAGVVLDDTRKHLGSFLREYPALGRLSTIFDTAEARGEKIPWKIRETWAKQIICAVADVHERGVIVSQLSIGSVGVRADGSAVLMHSVSSTRLITYLRCFKGYLAPELRDKPFNDPSLWKMNFQTDIFQLGLLLWLLAEHKWFPGNHLYCPMNACTNMPRFTCHEEHTDPVELSPCRGPEVPKYMDTIIRHCRRSDPSERMPARELLTFFRETETPSQMAGIVANLSPVDIDGISFYCDECGAFILDSHFHCNICDGGDMDFCRNCISRGIHCLVPQHRLIKRAIKNGVVIDLS